MRLFEAQIIMTTMRITSMLKTPLQEQLKKLKLQGIIDAIEEQNEDPVFEAMAFEDRMAHCIDKQIIYHENNRLNNRLKRAKLHINGCMEDIDYRQTRGLNKIEMNAFAEGNWIKRHRNIIIVGPTGTGKSFLACALAHKACLLGYQSYYVRLGRLFEQLHIARANGTYAKQLQSLAKIKVLLLDDLSADDFNAHSRKDLLELMDDRYGKLSTIVTSQFDIKRWHELIGDKTTADAILDRLVHNAYRITLKGPSMRKIRAKNQEDVTLK